MNEKTTQKTAELEIDLGRIFRAILDRAWTVAIVTVLCTVLVFLGTFFLVTPQYEASAMFYVNNTAKVSGDSSQSISSGDLSTSRNLVDSYLVILDTRETINEVIAYAGVNRSYREVKDMISAGAVNSTEIICVTVTSPNPNEAEKLANAIAYVMPQRITSIIEGSSTKVVDYAVVPSSPSSPSYVKNTILGFLLGLVLGVGMIVLRELFDISVRTEEDVAKVCAHPILASVPDMAAPAKGGSYYGGKHRSKKKGGIHVAGKAALKPQAMIGDKLSFTASEAYKLLRTKLQFSFADDGCRVIGLSSALSGEGKSLTSVNLACALAQLNKKVILIDCDMRRPTLAEKLRISKMPGLSSYLTGQCALMELVQPYSPDAKKTFLHVITAGQNPPNPVELLSSARMERMLDALRKSYDYVIIDLPPVGEVSDAMAVAKQTDGMLLVVRQNYCDRVVLSDAVRQFEFIGTRILGVVFNCTAEHTNKYGKRYASSYEHNDRSVADGSKKA